MRDRLPSSWVQKTLSVSAVFIAVVLVALLVITRVDHLDLDLESCRQVMDRNGQLLQFIPDSDGLRHIRVELDQIDQNVKNALSEI